MAALGMAAVTEGPNDFSGCIPHLDASRGGRRENLSLRRTNGGKGQNLSLGFPLRWRRGLCEFTRIRVEPTDSNDSNDAISAAHGEFGSVLK